MIESRCARCSHICCNVIARSERVLCSEFSALTAVLPKKDLGTAQGAWQQNGRPRRSLHAPSARSSASALPGWQPPACAAPWAWSCPPLSASPWPPLPAPSLVGRALLCTAASQAPAFLARLAAVHLPRRMCSHWQQLMVAAPCLSASQAMKALEYNVALELICTLG